MNATFPSHGARDSRSNGARDTRSSADAYSCSAPAIWRKAMTAASTGPLLDGQGALHAGLAMARHRAVVGVRSGLQRHVEALGPAVERRRLAEDLVRLVDQDDVVRESGVVGEVDRYLA